jgi:hypothetical protein
MERGKVEVQFEDVADILPEKEDVRISLWKVHAFLNPFKSSSLEMVLVDEKVSFLCVKFIDLFIHFTDLAEIC